MNLIFVTLNYQPLKTISTPTKIWLSSPHMGGMEKKYVDEAFETNWIAPLGPNVNAFEDSIKTKLGNSVHVAALSSGTAAIHLGLEIPKAIIAVHLYGMPYKVAEIKAVANEFQIPVLEDSAEALGSTYKEEFCGAFGDIGVLSFNGNKIITTSGGGALVSKNKSYTEMVVLSDRVDARRSNHKFYKDALNNFPEITFLEEPEGYFSNRWLSCILTSSYDMREKLRLALLDENIESRPLWKPLHLQPIFSKHKQFMDGTSEALFEKGLCLPSGSSLTQEDLERVVTTIKNVLS